ncbi:uncharacterized protein E0L32_007505 [Thyridium curvatum]|uniref:Uncharacterized protein n=1 Tax=Thyridium curvatum TaxID=1093900 RepID=A0A507B4H3_9PEZI|nr:uncharacterized protein E0L32_007505 [Thyridium curvatum]TPX11768.1 hypothetical protein E0L32_007505 [Thyridium curvatum]
MQMLLVTLLLTMGSVMAAPTSSDAQDLDIRQSSDSPSLSQVLENHLPEDATRERRAAPTEDPNICYANCMIAGGTDWKCICSCVQC